VFVLLGYYGIKERGFNAEVLAKTGRVTGNAVLYAFPIISAGTLFQLYRAEERV